MAVVDKQKVDLLYKKLFGVTKTDFSTLKGASNEVIPSPALIRGDTVWTQANGIIKAPAAPAVVNNIVEYRTVECIPDDTTTPIGGVFPTWIAKTTGGSPVEYKNWIPPEFGPGYLIEVFIGNPASGGTKIFDAGINDKGAYYFDYMSGVLNFTNYLDNGNNSNVIPDGLSGNSIWIRGYRYIGFVGITDQQEGKFGNLQLIDNTVTAINTIANNPAKGDVIIKPRLDGFVRFQGSRLTQHLSDSTTSYDPANPYNTTYEKTTLLARATTLNGEEKEVTLDGLAAGSTNRFFLSNNNTYKVSVDITAKLDGGTDSAIWNLQFLARRGANASETSIIGNLLTEKIAGSPATYITIATVSAGNFINGRIYKIKTLGNTNWVNIAKNKFMDYSVGSVFEAEFAGSDPSTGTTGVADEYFNPTQIATYSWTVKAEADTTNGLIKILVKGPTKVNGGDPDKTIYWLAAINTLEIYQT